MKIAEIDKLESKGQELEYDAMMGESHHIQEETIFLAQKNLIEQTSLVGKLASKMSQLDLDSLKRKMDNIDNAIKSGRDACASATSSKNELETQVKNLNSEFESIQDSIDGIEQKIYELELRIRSASDEDLDDVGEQGDSTL